MHGILCEETRGGIVENIHYGYISVTDADGKEVFSVGKPDRRIFYRSASKPLQVLPLLQMGLHKTYGLDASEIAIMCASQIGTERQLAVVDSLLTKCGIDENIMVMKPTYTIHNPDKNLPPRKRNHNCVGKHICMILLSRHFGEPEADYYRMDSKSTAIIKQMIETLTGDNEIILGVDGCGVPVFATEMDRMARSFALLAVAAREASVIREASVARDGSAGSAKSLAFLGDSLTEALYTVADAMCKNPDLIRGDGYPCTEINRDKNIVAKGGAKGVYGFGLKAEGLGVALKIEDGSEDTWGYIIAGIMKRLGYTNLETIERMQGLCGEQIINDNGDIVGERRFCP